MTVALIEPAGRRARAARRVAAVLALLAALAGLAVAGAAPALAHATVAGSDPAENSRLRSVPARVTVTFSEDVTVGAGYLKVVDSKGDTVSSGAAETDGRRVSVPVRPGLGDGSYVVSYRIVSADSHPISGAYAFVVGTGPLVAASGTVVGGRTDALVSGVFAVARFLSFAGVVLLGGLVFVLVCWPAGRTDPRARRLVRAGCWATAAGAVLGLVLQGPYAAGTGLGDVADARLLTTTLGTTYGRMLGARLALLAALAVLASRILREQGGTAESAQARDRDLAALCGVGVLVTYGAIGHPAVGATPALAVLADTAHIGAASVWIGGLVMLLGCLLPRRRAGELAGALPAFSRQALGCVAVLVVTGGYQAWREVWPVQATWSTSYGRLLLAKVATFLLAVAAAYASRQVVNRRYVRPLAHALSVGAGGPVAVRAGAGAPARGDRRAVRRLRTSVGIEVALGAVVLALAALLVSTAPARTTYVAPVQRTVRLASGGTAAVEITPARVGSNTLTVTVADRYGKAADARAVTATLALPADRYGPLPVPLHRIGTGRYSTAAASLTRTGAWKLVVGVQTSEFDRDLAQIEFDVG